MNKKILGGVSALAAGVVGTGVYLAVPASAGPSPSHPAAAKAGKADKAGKQQPRRHARAARGIHGQATVRTKKGFAQLDWQRGTLTAVNGGTLTVRSADGVTWQWKTGGATKVRKAGAKSAVAKLAKGDFVVVLGRDASGTRTAKRVVVPKKVPARATTSPAPSHN
jgi:Domain of unknown function (DUF5666)